MTPSPSKPFSKTFIDNVFTQAAPFYDRMNTWMSLGLHHTWKDVFVQAIHWQALAPKKQLTFLDMACGTGDIAARLMQKSHFYKLTPNMTLADKNEAMLLKGQEKHAFKKWTWCTQDAEKLSFKKNMFDLYTIAFGLRNVPDKKAALSEALRVLKPGGFFYCLEFSQPQKPLFNFLYQGYLKTWIPLLALTLTNTPSAYRYLTDSIQTFPKATLLEEMLLQTGFHQTGFQLLHEGIVAIHWGQKP